MYPVYTLHIPIQQKLALVVVFALGGFVLITSILRMTTIKHLTISDITYDNASTMWTIIEPNIAVMCACLPMTRPFLVQFFPNFLSRGTGRGSPGSKRNAGTGTYGSKSNNTGQGSQLHDNNEWLKLDGRGPVHMTTVKRTDSLEGSDEEIMLGDATHGSFDARHQGGIQRTMQVTVEYSSK